MEKESPRATIVHGLWAERGKEINSPLGPPGMQLCQYFDFSSIRPVWDFFNTFVVLNQVLGDLLQQVLKKKECNYFHL